MATALHVTSSRCVGSRSKHLQIGFPVHWKSSADGMRVKAILPPTCPPSGGCHGPTLTTVLPNRELSASVALVTASQRLRSTSSLASRSICRSVAGVMSVSVTPTRKMVVCLGNEALACLPDNPQGVQYRRIIMHHRHCAHALPCAIPDRQPHPKARTVIARPAQSPCSLHQ